jgi:hypothetical protein
MEKQKQIIKHLSNNKLAMMINAMNNPDSGAQSPTNHVSLQPKRQPSKTTSKINSPKEASFSDAY